MLNFFRKLFSFFKSFVARPGIQEFLKKYEKVALEQIYKLAAIHSNEDFHTWKDEAWTALRSVTGDMPGNWLSILLHLAFETYKAEEKKKEQAFNDTRG